jgi:uncharacterized protein YkuJ
LKKYILSSRFTSEKYSFDNISKLKLILLLKIIDKNNPLIERYTNELMNQTMIEARGTIIPSNNYMSDNTLSTAL